MTLSAEALHAAKSAIWDTLHLADDVAFEPIITAIEEGEQARYRLQFEYHQQLDDGNSLLCYARAIVTEEGKLEKLSMSHSILALNRMESHEYN
jgi:hypothetical protein